MQVVLPSNMERAYDDEAQLCCPALSWTACFAVNVTKLLPACHPGGEKACANILQFTESVANSDAAASGAVGLASQMLQIGLQCDQLLLQAQNRGHYHGGRSAGT